MTRKRGGATSVALSKQEHGSSSSSSKEGVFGPYENGRMDVEAPMTQHRRRRPPPLQRRVNTWRMSEERLSPPKRRHVGGSRRSVKAHSEELAQHGGSNDSYLAEVSDEEDDEEGDFDDGGGYRRRPAGVIVGSYRPRQSPTRRVAAFSAERPTPSVQEVLQDLGIIVLGYTRMAVQYLRKRFVCILRFGAAGALAGVVLAGVILALVVCSYYFQVTPKCRPPPSYALQTIHRRPFVEYYVHGRGNGHYARSVAIVETLKKAGVDVRIFVGRATMWRAMNEAKKSASEEEDARFALAHANRTAPHARSPNPQTGVTTVFAVSSTVPSMPFPTAVSHILERMNNDCEVSARTGRYPDLVVSDGDFPGMGRAYLGGIPSVGISHGQSFSVGQVPPWVQADRRLRKKWKSQRFINYGAAFFTDWQIGTNFLPLESSRSTAVIASSPMRPDVITMAQVRRRRQKKANHQPVKTTPAGHSERLSESFGSTDAVGHLFPSPSQHRAIRRLLELEQSTVAPRRNGESSPPHSHHRRRRRRLVICYFRDKNGDVLQSALLKSGFDVLLFERGYHKGLMNIEGVEKYGHKYILHHHDELDDPSPSHHQPSDVKSREAYWRQTLAKARLHQQLLGAHDDDENDAANRTTRGRRRRLQTFTLDSQEGGKSNTTLPSAVKRPKNTTHLAPAAGSTPEKRNTEHAGSSPEKRNTKNSGGAQEKKTTESGGNANKGGRNAAKAVSKTASREVPTPSLNSSFPDSEHWHEANDDESLPPPKIIRVTDMSLFVPLMAIADGVASSAGSQLISECIYANIPLLALYRENDDEQMFNVEMLRHHKRKPTMGERRQTSDRRLRSEKNVPPGSSDNKSDATADAGGKSRSGAHLVHGISLETFTNVFEFASKGSIPQEEASRTGRSNGRGSSGDHSSGGSGDELPAVELLNEEEKSRHLRTPAEHLAYDEFTDFVQAVTVSRVSRSFFQEIHHDTFELATTVADMAEINRAREAAFPGMPDAASVILEIIKEVTKGKGSVSDATEAFG